MNSDHWVEFQKFFKLKDDEEQDSEKLISISGLSKSLFPYQLYSCWWKMKTEQDSTDDGFNADYMKLNKVCNSNQMLKYIHSDYDFSLQCKKKRYIILIYFFFL